MTSVLCDLTGPGCLLKNTFLCQGHFAYLVALAHRRNATVGGLALLREAGGLLRVGYSFYRNPLPYSGRIFRVP